MQPHIPTSVALARLLNEAPQYGSLGWLFGPSEALICLRHACLALRNVKPNRHPAHDQLPRAPLGQAGQKVSVQTERKNFTGHCRYDHGFDGPAIAAGHGTTGQQAHALGVGRSTAWALLNRDKRVGPSSVVLKRILSSRNLPLSVRRKLKEYIEEKIRGAFGHGDQSRKRWVRNFRAYLS